MNPRMIPWRRSCKYPVFSVKKLRPKRLRNGLLDSATSQWDRTEACPQLQPLNVPGFPSRSPGFCSQVYPAAGSHYVLKLHTGNSLPAFATRVPFLPCIFFSTLPSLSSHVSPCSPQPDNTQTWEDFNEESFSIKEGTRGGVGGSTIIPRGTGSKGERSRVLFSFYV